MDEQEQVPQMVLIQLEYIRSGGLANMRDCDLVVKAAQQLRLRTLSQYLWTHRLQYGTILQAFECWLHLKEVRPISGNGRD